MPGLFCVILDQWAHDDDHYLALGRKVLSCLIFIAVLSNAVSQYRGYVNVSEARAPTCHVLTCPMYNNMFDDACCTIWKSNLFHIFNRVNWLILTCSRQYAFKEIWKIFNCSPKTLPDNCAQSIRYQTLLTMMMQ